jgi:hypothetical protein
MKLQQLSLEVKSAVIEALKNRFSFNEQDELPTIAQQLIVNYSNLSREEIRFALLHLREINEVSFTYEAEEIITLLPSFFRA